MIDVDSNGVGRVDITELSVVSTMSELCRLDTDKFLKHFEGKDLGYVRSARIIISSMYSQVRQMKDDVISSIKEGKHSLEEENVSKLLEESYSVLAQLEGKYFLLKDLEKQRTSFDSKN